MPLSDRDQGEAILTLMRHGWGRANSVFINAFGARSQARGGANVLAHRPQKMIPLRPDIAVQRRFAVGYFRFPEFSMSVQSTIRRKTSADIRARKNGEPIVMLTSYHAHTAALVDRYCDVILVGDSLGNVMHGFETTIPVR